MKKGKMVSVAESMQRFRLNFDETKWKESPIGEFIDSLADKVLEILIPQPLRVRPRVDALKSIIIATFFNKLGSHENGPF